VLEFLNKLGDTALWAIIGGSVLGVLLKLIQAVQTSLHRRGEREITIKLGSK
jgi:hypothetical protein